MRNHQQRRFLPLLYSLLVLLVLQACTSIPIEQRADKRAQLYQEAQDTVAQMIEQNPDIRQEMEGAAGYFVSDVSAATVAVLGGGQGIGVLIYKCERWLFG